MKHAARKSKSRGFLPRLQAVFGIQERWRLLAFAFITLFTLFYVLFLASQQVHPTGWRYTLKPVSAGWEASPPDETWSTVDLPFLQPNNGGLYRLKGYVELSGFPKPDVIVGAQDKVTDLYVNGVRVPVVKVDSKQVEDSNYGLNHNAYVIPASYFREGGNLVALGLYGREYAILGFSVPKATAGNSRVYVLFLLAPLLLFLVLKKESLSLKATALVVFLILALVFLKPLFHNFNYWGSRDWDITEGVDAVSRESVLTYRQLPLWNPYYSGGQPLLAEPNSMWLSPMFMVVLVFGVISGLKIQIILWYVIGLFGMYLLGKHYGLNTYACYLTAFAFMFSSAYSLKLTVGYLLVHCMSLLPWAFLFYLKGLADRKYAVLCALVLALMLFEGGIYMLVYTAMFLVLYAVFASIQTFLERKPGKDIVNFAATLFIVGLLCSAFSSVKTMPMLEYSLRYPAQFQGNLGGYGMKTLYYAFLGSVQMKYASDPMVNSSLWDNFGSYVGPVVLLLVVLGILSCARRHRPLLLIMVLGILLSFGADQSNMVFWNILRQIPVFSSLRWPSRFLLLAFFPITLFAGFTASRIEDRKNRITAAFAMLLSVLVFYNLLYIDSPTLSEAFTMAPRAVNPRTDFRQVTDRPEQLLVFSESYTHFLQNEGVVNGFGFIKWLSRVTPSAQPADSPNYRGEVYLHSDGGKASFNSFTPNRLDIEVQAGRDDTLIVNQDYDPGWRSTAGEVYPKDGLIAVDVTPDDREVVLYYSPTSFRVGLVVSVFSFLVVLYVLYDWRRRKVRKKRGRL